MASVRTGPAQPDSSDLMIAADPSAFSSTAPIQLTFGLSAPTLSSVEQDVNNPASPLYRQYLTYGETNSLGVSPATQTALVTYLESYGLTVSGNDLALNVMGTVAQVENALHTTLGAFEETYNGTAWNPIYDHVTGYDNATHEFVYTSEPRTFYSTMTSVELPSELASVVSGIAGLNGMIAQPQISAPTGFAPGVMPNQQNETNVTPPPTEVSSTAPGGAASVNLATGAANYTWASGFYGPGENLQLYFASTMPTLYGALPLWTGSGTLNAASDYGQGITIVVIEVGCVDPSIFASFSNATWGNSAELMGRLTYIALGTDGTGIGSSSSSDIGQCVVQGNYWGWGIETALDVEYSSTMAPHAHIDLLSVPSADFTAFDAAYQFAAEYLIGNTQCSIPSTWESIPLYPGGPAYSDVTVYGSTSDSYGGSACDGSLFSNSYGSGEQYIFYDGTSMYFAVEDELLEAMAAEGGTSLFASGDGGGVYATLNDFMPADSPAATSVGGGQLTAVSGTEEFPNTGISSYLTEGWESEYFFGTWYNYSYGYPVTVAPVTGSDHFTYWSGEEAGTFDGATGGGFGQSMTSSQAWWQNGLDTYSVGARIDPTVSGQAAFNMTIWYQECYSYNDMPYYEYQYCYGPYLFVYGGTSFATPLMAGDLALIEEQLQVRFGEHALGDANALLYAAHDAYEAGATSINPYIPMVNIGCDSSDPLPDWCFSNNFAWYYYNLSYQIPMDQGQPPWFATLFNPAIPPGWTSPTQYGGSSLWNYLQGLGLPEASLLDKVLVGQTSTDHGLTAEPFYVELVGSGGTLEPITTLTAGQTYTFEILTTLSGNLPYAVTAYSGGPNNGIYGGGTTSYPSLSEKLKFEYTPMWTAPLGDGYQTTATTYGYFYVSAITSGFSNYWSFQAFAVAPPTPTVAPQICVDDIYGICETGTAEVTQFLSYDLGGWYNLQSPTVLVTENGLPVQSATVIQKSIYIEFNDARNDPTLNPMYYQTGQVIGTYVTDARGTAFAWTNAWTAELNGSLPTQVYSLTAYVDGVASNTVTVYVEPQSGSFFLNDLVLGSNGYITGTVYLNDMTNLEWANISLQVPTGVQLYPDQYVNESFVGVNNAAMTVSLNTKELPSGVPAIVTAQAMGWNNLGYWYQYCYFGYCYTYTYYDVQNPIVWQDPTVFLPATISASATGTVVGTDTFTWSGASYTGATGVLTLVSGSGSTVLTTGISGTYVLNTATLPDGSYSVTYTESAPGAVTSVQSVSFYADNQAASDNQLIATLQSEVSADAATISALQATMSTLQSNLAAANATIVSLQASLTSASATIASLQSNLAAANATIASLQSQVNTLTSQVTTLQGQLATAQATAASLETQISALQSENSVNATAVASLQAQLAQTEAAITADQNTIASDQTSLANANAQLSTDTTQIASLNSEVQTLQNELNAKKNYVAPAWYTSIGPGGIVLLIGGVAALVGLAAYFGGRNTGRKSRVPVPAGRSEGTTAPAPAKTEVAVGPEASLNPEAVVGRAMAAASIPTEEGRFGEAYRLTEMTNTPASKRVGDGGPPELLTMYR